MVLNFSNLYPEKFQGVPKEICNSIIYESYKKSKLNFNKKIMDKYTQNLKKYFGFDDFRFSQREIVESVVEGNNTLVFMPTGGGKSLTYQLPALMREGVAIVISPLISLMKDQVDALRERGIRAELINSTIDFNTQQNILNEISKPHPNPPLAGEGINGPIKFLYIAPERLNSGNFLRVLENVKISLIAIDEAHCISQWGHDFRPSYMKVKDFIKKLQKSPPLTPPPSGEGDRKSLILQNYSESPNYLKEIVLKLRKNQTEYESILWEVLRGKKLAGIKFRRQHPFGRYIADFFSSELKLVIEIDGKIHDNQQEYDKIREDIIKQYGVKILRFSNDEIINNLDIVLEKILLSLPPEGGKVRLGELNVNPSLGESRLGELNIKSSFPVMGLTATATQKVKKDIVERLDLKNIKMFTSGFDRKNIILIVREISKKDEKKEKVFEILKKTPGSGIIYCSSRKAVDEVYDFLIDTGVKAGKYTGAMTPDIREDMQNKFMNDEYKVVVATNAFGMGIDKKDIRFVIHYNLPGSIENYYQEVGRAGRDGKNSFGVVLASYGDTKIQEFFIENSYPPKKEILDFYDYLHDTPPLTPPLTGEGNSRSFKKEILKTQFQMAEESNLNNAMKVGTILKILEKYGILRKGVEDSGDFRGRGVTLTQEKRQHSHLMIDWKHQVKLEDEAYFKLEQVKKMLFYPHCRRKFILEYFGDGEDLDKIGENCGTCDFCIDSKKFASGEIKDLVPISVFGIVLDTIKENDERFGVVMFARMLTGSQERKLLDAHLDESDFYGALEDYKKALVKAVIESLIDNKFLFKSEGSYPVIGLTQLGEDAIYKESYLKEKNRELQQAIHMKYKKSPLNPPLQEGNRTKSKSKKSGNYKKTLELFNSGKTVDEIAEIEGFKKQTIENHLLKLYENGQLDLAGIMKTVNFSNLKHIKNIITKYFPNGFEFLKDVKNKCLEEGQEVQRNEISICKVMMDKKDI